MDRSHRGAAPGQPKPADEEDVASRAPCELPGGLMKYHCGAGAEPRALSLPPGYLSRYGLDGDPRSYADKQADVRGAVQATSSLLRAPEATAESVREQLPDVTTRYNVREVSLEPSGPHQYSPQARLNPVDRGDGVLILTEEEKKLLRRWMDEAGDDPNEQLLLAGLTYIEREFRGVDDPLIDEAAEKMMLGIMRARELMKRPFERPEELSERHQSLFRAIRARPTSKKKTPSSEKEKVSGNPDGNLFSGMDIEKRTESYQSMKSWPQTAPIRSIDPTSNEPVVRQVSGDNYGTQYMSTSQDLMTAFTASAYDWSGGGGSGGLRLPRFWGPVIEIAVSKLPGSTRLHDLSETGPHRDKLWGEGEDKSGMKSGIRSMAERDTEVLVSGVISGESVIKVWSVPEIVAILAKEKRSFIDELRRKVLNEREGRVTNSRDREILQQAGVLDQIEPQQKMESDEEQSEKWVPLSQRKQLKEEKSKIEPRDTRPLNNRNLLSFNMDDDMEEETPQSPQPTSTSFKKQNQKGGRRVRNKDTSMMMEEEKSGSSNVDTQMNDDT